MERDELIRYTKLIVILALIIGIVGAVAFLVYGFTFIWQAMAATIISIFLSITTILFIALSIYLWIKNLMLKREVSQREKEIEKISSALQNCNKKLNEKKSLDQK